ncbi:hypothetical protein KC19_5G057700, partial [Ceratodon purpureus]
VSYYTSSSSKYCNPRAHRQDPPSTGTTSQLGSQFGDLDLDVFSADVSPITEPSPTEHDLPTTQDEDLSYIFNIFGV